MVKNQQRILYIFAFEPKPCLCTENERLYQYPNYFPVERYVFHASIIQGKNKCAVFLCSLKKKEEQSIYIFKFAA